MPTEVSLEPKPCRPMAHAACAHMWSPRHSPQWHSPQPIISAHLEKWALQGPPNLSAAHPLAHSLDAAYDDLREGVDQRLEGLAGAHGAKHAAPQV